MFISWMLITPSFKSLMAEPNFKGISSSEQTHGCCFLWLKAIFVVFVWPVAYNGHTDCLRLLLQYSNTENSLDCTDADAR